MQVDVFTETPFMGNPVAVILEAEGLGTEEMQQIASWTNLSETTFVLPPTEASADYRLRIFTPRHELPFAGHPTIGSAWALLEHGLKPKKGGQLIQQCGKGLIELKLEGRHIHFALPEPSLLDCDNKEAAEALGIEEKAILQSSLVDVGAVWHTIRLPSRERVLALKPDMGIMSKMRGSTGITVFAIDPSGNAEVRSFAPAAGVPEDPVCGSGNGAVAALIRRHNLISSPSYSAFQGRSMGRDGRIEVKYENDGIWIGGCAVTCIRGELKG